MNRRLFVVKVLVLAADERPADEAALVAIALQLGARYGVTAEELRHALFSPLNESLNTDQESA